MTLLAPTEAIEESRRIIEALERRRHTLPLAVRLLETYRPAHEALEQNNTLSVQAVSAWRGALAHRWACEVAGRRIFKQLFQQLAEELGADAPEVQLLSRGGAEANSLPSELLSDLRRLRAALALDNDQHSIQVPLAELDHICAELEQAITETHVREAERRTAVINRRLAQEAYRRIRKTTRDMLWQQGGIDLDQEIGAASF
jgi:hypothetical protein